MPETASKLPEEDRPQIRPENLRNRENAGGGSTGTTGGGSSSGGQPGGGAGSTSTSGGLYNPNDLKNAEESPDEADNGQLGQGFTPAPARGRVSRLRSKVTKRRAAIGAGVAGAGVGGAAVLVFMLIPLKVENIVTNLQSHFFGTSEDAVGQETDNMLQNYIVTKVLPAYKRCGSTIDKSCTPRDFGSNPVGKLYRTWANARLENNLASNYGIEFQYHPRSNTWYLKAPGTDPGGDDIGTDGNNLGNEFQRSNRSGMRQAIRDAMKSETKWNKVMYRYKVGRLLEEKYGIKRCIIFCGTKDALADKAAEQKIAAKLFLTQRVLSPYTQTLGIAMECLMDPNCTPEKTQSTPASDGTTGEESGSPQSEFDTKVQTKLVAIGATYGSTATPEELLAAYNKLKDKGYQAAVLDTILEKVGLNDIGGQVLDKAALIGWVNQAANTIVAIHDAGPKLKKLSYVIKSSAFVSAYMMARTYADEVHTGHVNANEVGSMVGAYGPGTSTGPDDPITGGPGSAESTTLYQQLNGETPPSNNALLNNALGSKVYAATANDASTNPNAKGEICNNGNPVPAGLSICPEDKAGGGNEYVSSVSSTLDTPPLSYISGIAGVWKNTVGGIFSFAGNIFGSIINAVPGVTGVISDVTSFVAKAAQPFMDFLTNKLIPNDFGSNQGGARNYTQAAGGADVAGSDYAHTGLGAQQVTPNQYAAIMNKQQDEARQSFSHQSFFARMFGTNSQYSLVSKIAMDVPGGVQVTAQSGFASLLNPIGAVSHGFASIFSGRVNAATPAQPDPFGVTQYAYPPGTIPSDPEKYWDQHCSDNASNAYMKDNSWNEAAANGPVDPVNGTPVNATTNPCLLIKASVGSAGGLFDTSNLTSDDLADQQQSSVAGLTTPAAGDTQQLAQQILQQAQAGKIKFAVVNPANSSDGSTAEDNIKETAAGNPAKTSTSCLGGGTLAPNRTTNLSATLLQFIVGLSNTTTFTINELAGGCHSPTSNHYVGKAVDFGCPFDPAPADAAGKKYNIFDGTGETCSNAEHYHYSIGGG